METRTRFVFLMHPKEFKREKAATGRLTHLSLARSEIHMGVGFNEHAAVAALVVDPKNYPVLLYPGAEAHNLSRGELTPGHVGARNLVVFVLDGTWSCSRSMLKRSPLLQHLPRVAFTPSQPSRYVIKRQPQEGCLSTLEAVHEVLLGLERSRLDQYVRPTQLLALFERMQARQIEYARQRSGTHHHDVIVKDGEELAFSPAAAVGSRRRRYLKSRP